MAKKKQHATSKDTMRPAERKMMEWFGMTKQSRQSILEHATEDELQLMDATDKRGEMIRICASIAARRDETVRNEAKKASD